MIWSFTKIAAFFVVIAALTYGATLLSDSGEMLVIQGLGYELNLAPVQAVILVGVLVLAIWVLIRLGGMLIAFLRFLNGDETALSRYFDRNRERKGYEALSEGMMALASGEGKVALSKAAKAEKLLGRPQLTNLLAAQAAEMVGDTRQATTIYKKLLADDRTRFVGVRGLMKQKLAEGDTATALKLAEKAFSMKPKHIDTQDTLLKLQAESGDWKGARAVLSTKARQGALPKDVHRRRDAVLALQEAKGVFDESASIEAQEAAIAANKASPDLIPAAAMAARSYIAAGKAKNAARVLQKAWAAQPHPDLASAYAEIAPDEDAAARLKRFEALIKQSPDAEESRLLKAELLIATEDFPAARRALGDLIESRPTVRALTIMAAVERGEGADDTVVRGWLTRALTAPRGKQWVCDTCQAVHDDWTPVCESCGGFDTLSWRDAPHSGNALPHGAEMLPLIVGKPAVEEAEEVTETTESIVEDAEILPLDDAVALSRKPT